MKVLFSISLLLLNIFICLAQENTLHEEHKCGVYHGELKSSMEESWGYSYDSLLHDLSIWELSEFVDVTSIGKSFQQREIYEMTITDFEIDESEKQRIYIHSRTHPGEIQAAWVTDEIINYLLSDTEIGSYLRERCIFHIIPMYNPDGVELEYPRENANGIDIESNWSSEYPEIEVVHLKERFKSLMQYGNPIKIALNMHSAYACKRYFVYHHENGTSQNFAQMEQFYISSTRSHFMEGIEPYSYYVSWTNGTPNQYPESWWWQNHGEEVMALTYEDMNCSTAGFYDKTAFAILHGISDYLDLGLVGIEEYYINSKLEIKAYPNPFADEVTIEWNNYSSLKNAVVYDITGRTVRVFSEMESKSGLLNWNGTDNSGNMMPPGTYILRVVQNNQIKNLKIIKN
jgi:hypothetical protein